MARLLLSEVLSVIMYIVSFDDIQVGEREEAGDSHRRLGDERRSKRSLLRDDRPDHRRQPVAVAGTGLVAWNSLCL